MSVTGRSISTRLGSGGLAAWSIRHPVGVTMIALAVVVLGLFSFQRLSVNLLPDIIYPEVRIRINYPGVPPGIMEDSITRQLEEQLAITENAINVRSRSSEGRSSVDLSFPYGIDMDTALRDASIRLDRAKRFLPKEVEPPVIFKHDPSQIPIAEFIISSSTLDPVQLRSWVDDGFRKWFLNLPGIAAVEVGGGLVREIQITPDIVRLAAMGLDLADIENTLKEASKDYPGGRLETVGRIFGSRTIGRVEHIEDIASLPLTLPDGGTLRLDEVAQVIDTHQDEQLRIRYDSIPGVKLTIQKQPTANTVEVVDLVRERMNWLVDQNLLSSDIEVHQVRDQSVFIRQSLHNAAMAGLSGAILAMIVVFLFLGDLRRTLIIGSALPIAVTVTFIMMDAGSLTLNVMTLGGLAVGIGMLVDSTIVMLENIQRHQVEGESPTEAGLHAAREVNSAIVASTSTNLAAILPFLFVVGLTGLLFRELIFTISAAIFASMVVALTLVPAWAARLPAARALTPFRLGFNRMMSMLQDKYAALLGWLLRSRIASVVVVVAFVAGLSISLPAFLSQDEIFLPSIDNGEVLVRITADPGTPLEKMDQSVRRIEDFYRGQPGVRSVYSIVGGFVFGRSQRERPSRATLYVQLDPVSLNQKSSQEWIDETYKTLSDLKLVGFKVRMRIKGLHGLRVGGGEEDVTLRVIGPDLEILNQITTDIARRIEGIPGVRNVVRSGEEVQQELAIRIDRERAAQLGLGVDAVGTALAIALQGRVVSTFLEGDREYDIRLRLPRVQTSSIEDLNGLLLFASDKERPAVHLGDVAFIELVAVPSDILRVQQQRMMEVEANLAEGATLSEVSSAVKASLVDLQLPGGYTLYDAGSFRDLRKGRQTSQVLLGLALFLVFVVMAVQYESLRDPAIIMLGVPFAIIGVAMGFLSMDLPISMPVWLGLIMLAGIVVNNAIVLVEYIELLRGEGKDLKTAITEAGRLRLRPILMTTLTTVVGLMPLAIGVGTGSEMLRPLALTIVYGLSFSLLVSLMLIPVIYYWFNSFGAAHDSQKAPA